MSIAKKLDIVAENTSKVFNAGYEKGKAEVIPAKEEQEKKVTINKNGTTEVLPDENKVLSKVNVEVDVPSSGGDYTNEEITALINRKITEFTILDGCKSVGDYGFKKCANMINIQIPNSVVYIGISAFSDCRKLSLNELPNSVTTIGAYAFENCYNLPLSKLPTNLMGRISQYTFSDCRLITIDAIPEAVTYIDSYAFLSCPKITVNSIPQGVETIDSMAFANCIGITELTFKGTPTTIRSNSFYNCTNLLNIYVPWSEGEVANAPWGATNATIHYNSEVSNAES